MRTVFPGAVTQFAVLDALLAGAYESGMPAAELSAHGDFGIGCGDRLGGEVVLLDGVAYECTLGEAPAAMAPDEVLPFADVCAFPDMPATSASHLDLAGLTAAVEDALVSRNLFHAVRWDGVLTAVRTRVTPRQERPLRPLPEVTSQQVETVSRDVAGTLVGFWTPAIYQGIGVAGLHLHFLSRDRGIGGHVLDATVGDGALRVAGFARLDLHLPVDETFLRTELTHDDDGRIVAVEGGVPGR